MKIVDKLIESFARKTLNDLEELSEELKSNPNAKPIEQNMDKLHNQEVYRKIFKKQTLLTILRIF